MNTRQILKFSEKFVGDNSPAILTGIGLVGVVTTAYLTGSATVKATRIVDNAEKRGGAAEHWKTRLSDRAGLVWTLYIPPVLSCGLTVTSLVLATKVGTRRAAAMTAAYTISERAFSEYREKVVEKLGARKEAEVREEIVQAWVTNNPLSQANLIVTGTEEILCLESYTGRYFMSSMETIKKAQNDTNYAILMGDGYASLGDFQQRIGLPHTDISEEVGWTSDQLLEIEFLAVLAENGRPCMSIAYSYAPIRNYHKFS